MTSQITWVKGHQYGMSALVPQTPFGGETSADVTGKCRLFSQATNFRAGNRSIIVKISVFELKKVHFASLSLFSPFHFYHSGTVF